MTAGCSGCRDWQTESHACQTLFSCKVWHIIQWIVYKYQKYRTASSIIVCTRIKHKGRNRRQLLSGKGTVQYMSIDIRATLHSDFTHISCCCLSKVKKLWEHLHKIWGMGWPKNVMKFLGFRLVHLLLIGNVAMADVISTECHLFFNIPGTLF